EVAGDLLFLAIDRLGGWNVVREELLGLAFVVAGLIALYRLMQRTLPPLAADGAFAVASWLLAGPIAFENFLIGGNLGWPLCTAAVIVVVERLSAPRRSSRDAALAAIVALVASFSLAQGLL